jgi:Signal recognition particle GTPase
LIDVVIIDTAGRLHIDDKLMAEIKQIADVTRPTETLLAMDCMMGQDAAKVTKAFACLLPLTGIILTKADGDSRGGAALTARALVKQPIKFIGTGEKIEALEAFYPERIASRILGMGDILGLVEDAYEKIDLKQASLVSKKLTQGHKFNFEDFKIQLQQLKNLGGLEGLLGKLPKFGQSSKLTDLIDPKNLVKMEAIIDSMTIKERRFPAFIKVSNKKRIAAGSGTQLSEVNRLLKQLEQAQKMSKQLKGSKIQGLAKHLGIN